MITGIPTAAPITVTQSKIPANINTPPITAESSRPIRLKTNPISHHINRNGQSIIPTPVLLPILHSTSSELCFALCFPHGIISIGIILLPSPGILAHLLDAVFCVPAKFFPGFGGIRITSRNITGTPLFKDIINL